MLEIVQTIGVILHHAKHHENVMAVLEETEGTEKIINNNTEHVIQLPDAKSILSLFIDETAQEFESI